MKVDIQHLRGWIGKTETHTDQVTPTPLAALAAVLDRDDPVSTAVPPLRHWLYFLRLAKQSELGTDGHPKRGGFLPPVPLARRMWAGSRLEFHRSLRVGESISRTSRVVSVNYKEGQSGPLVFVQVRHEISADGGLALTEEQDLVYRDAPSANESGRPPTPASTESAWRREVHPDPILLFRYSALTFNGHRIHYDRQYAMEVEHYGGLVVHGPLIATLLLDTLQRNLAEREVVRFSFRAVRPLYDTAPFLIYGMPQPDGKTVKLWTADAGGWLTMEASAVLA